MDTHANKTSGQLATAGGMVEEMSQQWSGDSGDAPTPAMQALRLFYTRLHLEQSDSDLLWKQRGLSPETVVAMGFRSNLKSNKEILLAMGKEFPPLVLVDSGLWSQGDKPTDPPKPNPQFYGMSLVEKRDLVTGKKVRDAVGEPMVECVWGDPGAILIPYFDAAGELVHLRPHKGMMKGKTPRLYVARPGKTWLALQSGKGIAQPTPKYAGITEGEFKAVAIWQVLGGEAAVAALPGITMAKMLFGDVEEWLEEMQGIRQVFVGYDNEDKGNPQLPGYQEERWRRFDAQIWAWFLADRLAKEGFEGKICMLPNEWRDHKGKADWDGQLAKMLDAEFTRLKTAGQECGGMELWAKAKPAVRAAFETVVRASIQVHNMGRAGLFNSEDERVIKKGLGRISFERSLPIGGDDEEAVARRLQRLVARLRRDEVIPSKARDFLSMLAKRYSVLKDCYYIFKKLSPKVEEQWEGYSEKASNQSDSDLKRACEIALKGLPETVSDFHLKAEYVLSRSNNTKIRLVSIVNIHGERTALVPLDSAPFAQPSKFREWLLDWADGATWCAGERELNALQKDIARDLAFKSVSEITIRGYDAASQCWFFDDATYTPDGTELFADKSGIIWVRVGGAGRGYKLSDKDQERENFCQGSPKMHPEVKISDEELKLMFQEVSSAMNQTLGASAGCLALGAVLAYGAGPEIYEQYTAFPGLWLHGETNQGKSSVARWLMKFWGFKNDGGMPLPDSTKPGVSIAMQQYGNIPVWLEEFQPDAPKWMLEKIKNFYNRESGIKKNFDEGTRKILTNAIITGIATCSDAQVKSRYVHLQVSAKNRKVNHLEWFEKHSGKFYLLGRYILQHRKEFAAKTLAHMNEWFKSPEMATVDQRVKVVHGASYGAFAALAEMLKSHQPIDLTKFRAFLLVHCVEAVSAVREQVNVNLFWRDLLDSLSSHAFGETGADLLMIFRLDEYTPAVSPVSKIQTEYGARDTRYAWPSYTISFIPGPVIEKLMAHKKHSGGMLPLKREDLMSQMETHDYWVPQPPSRTQKRFGKGAKNKVTCWTVDVDKHELGLRRVTDDEFMESLYVPGKQGEGILLPAEEWVDPRKGDLFQLVELLLKAKAK